MVYSAYLSTTYLPKFLLLKISATVDEILVIGDKTDEENVAQDSHDNEDSEEEGAGTEEVVASVSKNEASSERIGSFFFKKKKKRRGTGSSQAGIVLGCDYDDQARIARQREAQLQ